MFFKSFRVIFFRVFCRPWTGDTRRFLKPYRRVDTTYIGTTEIDVMAITRGGRPTRKRSRENRGDYRSDSSDGTGGEATLKQ